MPDAEAPFDPLATYSRLIAEHGVLAGIEPVDANVAGIRDEALRALKDRIIDEVNQSLLAPLVQLDELSASTVADTLGSRIREIQERYKDGLNSAASFLIEHAGDEDPRVEAIARRAGILTTEAAVEGDQDQQDMPAFAMAAKLEEGAQSPPSGDSFPTAEDAQVGLQRFAHNLRGGTIQKMTPSQLWAQIAPGTPYDGRARRLLSDVLDKLDPESGFTLTHNGKRGRGAAYTLTRSESAVGTTDQVREPVQELSAEFDINNYFSSDDALVLATFLFKFNHFLNEYGIAPIETDAIMPLLDASSAQESRQSNDTSTLRELRTQTVAKIGTLLQNHQLLERAIEDISESDPRYKLFEHLFDVLNEQTYPVLQELLEAEKDYIVAIDAKRKGVEVVGADGVVRLRPGSTLTQLRDVLSSGRPDAARLAQIAVEEEEEQDLKLPESGIAEQTPPADSKAPRKTAKEKQLAECRQVIGDLLNTLRNGGVNFAADSHPISVLRGHFGASFSRAVGKAIERNTITRPASGNQQSRRNLSLVDAVAVMLEAHSDPKVESAARRHRKALRDVIEGAVNSIAEQQDERAN